MSGAWRDTQGIFDGRDLATLTIRAFNLSPRNRAWRRRRAVVKAAQGGPTGAFALANHPETLDWVWAAGQAGGADSTPSGGGASSPLGLVVKHT